MKVLLVHPPLSYPETIYSSVPILLGQLKYNNIDATAIDLNVEFLHDILSKKNLTRTVEKLKKIYKAKYNSKSGLSENEFIQRKQFIEKFIFKNPKRLDYIINNSQDLFKKHVSSQQELQLNGTYEKISQLLFISLNLAFLPYAPSKIVITNNFSVILEKNSLYSLNYNDLINRCNNKLHNIYIEYFENKIKTIKANQYNIIFISIPFENDLYPALTLARLLKKHTKAKIVLGGCIINSTYKSYMKYPIFWSKYFDALMTGEGEYAILDYIKYAQKKLQLSEISGLVYKEQNKIKNNPIKWIQDVNSIKPPSYDGFDFNNYKFKAISLEFAKGCYWGNCIYCYSNMQKRYHVKDANIAVDTIEYLKNKYNISEFNILDDSTNINFLSKFADEIIRRNLKIKYSVYLRFEKILTYEKLEKFNKSGLSNIFFGLESGSERILRIMNKGIDKETAARILKDCHRLNIINTVGFIFGFPTETEKDLIDTVNFINENKAYIDRIASFYFTFTKSSRIFDYKEALKITNIQDIEEFAGYLSCDIQENIPREKTIEIIKKHGIEALLNIYTQW